MPPHVLAYPVVGLLFYFLLQRNLLFPSKSFADKAFRYLILITFSALWPLTAIWLVVVGIALAWDSSQRIAPLSKEEDE